MTPQEIVDEIKKLSADDREKVLDLARGQIEMCRDCWGESGCFCHPSYDV